VLELRGALDRGGFDRVARQDLEPGEHDDEHERGLPPDVDCQNRRHRGVGGAEER